ncbi:MAG: transposase [Acidithiobacillus sp.]|jgi:putative transposase|uniref:RNA-guided endonuclease InsQ/TnpB family protein n=1 Tax=Acidithiobacillus sp. TaxID=1872118 RepID=UPI00355FD84B
MQLTEQIQLKSTSELSYICHLTKNLYNEALFQYRQFFFNLEEFLNYYDLQIILKKYDCYKQLPAQTAQQILDLVMKNWKSYWASLKEYKTNPTKFLGRPKPPQYKAKNGECIAIFTNQNTRIKNGYIHFPKSCNLPPIKTRIIKYQQIRIIPKGNYYICEIVYNYEPKQLNLNPNNVIGIDLGLNNLITAVNNIGEQPFIIKGGIVKSINQFYNKINAFLQSNKDKQHYEFQTKQQQLLLKKRNNQVHNLFHHISRITVDYCIENDIGTIVIGYNESWKQKSKMGKRNNQNFIQLPFLKLIQQIIYKAKMVGINVIIHEESYTSKCSFLDYESIEYHDQYCGKRIKRGLFRSKNGNIINADVNSGYNIIKKALPNVFDEGIEGLVLIPYSIHICCN